ncbi:MAG TPA: HAMP domain-containing sensor histidine kinase [Candidatus Polarisedimenticolaceae bacterium]|nr:HAMP domain-containing sensor histidine kinase [Candidatus Polarisedimenticolaceae bacterium]
MAPPSKLAAEVRLGWWAAPLVVGVLLVNLAGVWEIAAALRGLREHGERMLRAETAALARTVESRLAATTVDLAFLVGSPALAADAVARDDRWRDEAGTALLLFLRGHPEVRDLVVRDDAGSSLIEAGRQRGVPGFWTPGPGSPSLGAAEPAMRREFEVSGGGAGGPGRLEASLDPRQLVDGSSAQNTQRAECALVDAGGSRLAGAERAANSAEAAESAVGDADWGAPGPWKLRCVAVGATPGAELEPLVARHRMTILLNLVVMALAVGLGTFALQQQRRRRELEQRARHEAEVRELERQLFHAERLGTVGRLAAGMAHEINNPLEGIANYLRLAAEAVERGDGESARRHLDGVRQGTERAAAILRRVLDHADPSTALVEEVDVGDVVSRSIEFVRARPEFASIRFAVELPTPPARTRGSSVLLGQVFLNLVLNACEAQPAGGEVAVRCAVHARGVDVEVADRGPGVPPARRGRIFEPFESTKRSAGLGLSICHSIVERHGGELSVHERDGGGAVFRVRLVAAEVERTDGAA